MKRYIILLFAFLLVQTSLFAQSGEMIVSAPNVVAVGEPFRVEFKMSEVPSDFSLPQFKDFELIAGPTQSYMTSVNIINGKRESKAECIYTCVLIATNAGNREIGAATATFANSTLKSRATPIEVVGEGGGNQSSNANPNAQTQKGVSKDDILLLVSVNKRKVYSGEAIVASIKLATRVELAGVEGAKYPTFNGFWTQELPVDNSSQWLRENINNKIYDTKVIKKYLLFPQRSGELSIDKMSMDIVARIAINQPARRSSIFDDFFGGGGSVQNIKRNVESSKIDINVEALPQNAPASFSGAVGDFSIQSILSNDILSANSSGNLKVKISGKGNLPLITEPIIEFPSSFETYNVKSSDNYSINASGAVGDKVFDYPFIARAAGKYDIPSVEFTYFNPTTKKYHTLQSQTNNIAITIDTTSNEDVSSTKVYTGVNKEELKILGSDIKFISTPYPNFIKKNSFFVFSFGYFVLLIVLILLFVVLFVLASRRASLNKDFVRVKSSKARKVALSRLKVANSLMNKGETDAFYQEMLRGMWGYCGDKLNIDVASLSKSNIDVTLSSKGVDSDLIKKYISVIEECEFAQYTPNSSNKMNDLYNEAVNVIVSLEEIL